MRININIKKLSYSTKITLAIRNQLSNIIKDIFY